MANGDLSVMSSSSAWGVAAWPNGRDVELTYTWSDLGLQGYDRLPAAAPTTPPSDADASDPRQWIRFGDAIS